MLPGEVLRRIDIPASALRKRNAVRRFTLTELGRSTIFMVGTQSADTADFLLTITAGTPTRSAWRSTPCPTPTSWDTGSMTYPTTCGSTTRTERLTIAAIWRSTTPTRSASNSAKDSRRDVHGERQDVRRAARSRPVSAHLRAIAGLARSQEGL